MEVYRGPRQIGSQASRTKRGTHGSVIPERWLRGRMAILALLHMLPCEAKQACGLRKTCGASPLGACRSASAAENFKSGGRAVDCRAAARFTDVTSTEYHSALGHPSDATREARLHGVGDRRGVTCVRRRRPRGRARLLSGGGVAHVPKTWRKSTKTPTSPPQWWALAANASWPAHCVRKACSADGGRQGRRPRGVDIQIESNFL